MYEVNLKKLKPYGDRLDDGAVQLSFTLPVKASPEAKEAAKQYAEHLNLENVSVVTMEPMGEDYTYFVIYATAIPTLDFTKIKVPKLEFPELDYYELRDLMEEKLDEPIVVVGACTGADAHTVGIDAILNMKGVAGDYGLERYPKFKVYNLRAQLSNEELIEKAIELKADALLVSQVVSQRESHVKNLKALKNLLKKEKRLPKDLITIIGGPKVDQMMAMWLGFNAGFGPETKPSQVASFIIKEYFKKKGISHEIAEKEKELPFEEFEEEEDTISEAFVPLVYQQPKSGFTRAHREKDKRRPSPGRRKKKSK
jgi:beta-lysine 5,6-aminomutase beta subunit